MIPVICRPFLVDTGPGAVRVQDEAVLSVGSPVESWLTEDQLTERGDARSQSFVHRPSCPPPYIRTRYQRFGPVCLQGW